MEVNMENTNYPKPKIEGKNQFYYRHNKENNTWVVMKRFKTRSDKAYKTYKTEKGARNSAFHSNLN